MKKSFHSFFRCPHVFRTSGIHCYKSFPGPVMKKLLYGCFILLLFILILLFPKIAIAGASRGLLLWFQVLIPTLFRFMLLCRLLLKTRLLAVIARILYPVLGKLFGTTPEGAYCVLTGFLCGYPMGADAVSSLYREKVFSKAHAHYLICFCNNVSGGFLSGFILTSCLHNQRLMLPCALLLYGIPVLFSFLLRHMRPYASELPAGGCFGRFTKGFSDMKFADFNECIRESLAAIGQLGGYVILFCILSQFFLSLPLPSLRLKSILAGILEITSGIPLIASTPFSPPAAFALILACASFGGLSGAAQTWGILKPCGLSLRIYLISKAIQALVTGAAAFLLGLYLF